MRFFLEISYHGLGYFGWQRQSNEASVQETIEKAISTLSQEKIEVVGCGRTDKGVHARQYFLHFDIEKLPDAFLHHLNSLLPKDIAAHRLIEVDAESHARFDASERAYEYQMHFLKDPFREKSAYHYYHSDLDFDKMKATETIFKKYQDYSPLSKLNPDLKPSLCKVEEARWLIDLENDDLRFIVRADRFLHSMVRRMVGCTLLVGRGQLDLEEMESVMAEVGSFKQNISVPPHGLYLTNVAYPYID